MQEKGGQWWSVVGVVMLALMLPVITRGVNSLQRFLVGAEGRLAAIGVETDHVLGPLPQPWQGLAQGGEETKTFLDGNEEKVRALKPKYIRIDHIYDGFDVVGKNENGLTYDWTELDKLVDKITAVGAKPFFSLSYMPPAISSGDIVSEPNNWNDWADVVQRTIKHYSGEKGLADVYYEVWNEPDLFGKWTMGGKKDYKKLYAYSIAGAREAKDVQNFKIGGPGTTGLYKNWLNNFFPYILDNNLRLDFFSWHRYDLNVDKYTEDVANVDKWLDSHPYFSQVEKVVSEMGPSSEVDKENNTKQGAVQLIAAARELMFKVKWGLNFSITGGWGILGKPREEALKMLARLGSQRLSVSGEGTWVRGIGAKDGETIQIFLVNYDAKGAHSEVVPVSFMSLKNNKFLLRETFLGGKSSEQEVATTEAMWQKEIPMMPNSAVLLELTPVNSSQASASQSLAR